MLVFRVRRLYRCDNARLWNESHDSKGIFNCVHSNYDPGCSTSILSATSNNKKTEDDSIIQTVRLLSLDDDVGGRVCVCLMMEKLTLHFALLCGTRQTGSQRLPLFYDCYPYIWVVCGKKKKSHTSKNSTCVAIMGCLAVPDVGYTTSTNITLEGVSLSKRRLNWYGLFLLVTRIGTSSIDLLGAVTILISFTLPATRHTAAPVIAIYFFM